MIKVPIEIKCMGDVPQELLDYAQFRINESRSSTAMGAVTEDEGWITTELTFQHEVFRQCQDYIQGLLAGFLLANGVELV